MEDPACVAMAHRSPVATSGQEPLGLDIDCGIVAEHAREHRCQPFDPPVVEGWIEEQDIKAAGSAGEKALRIRAHDLHPLADAEEP